MTLTISITDNVHSVGASVRTRGLRCTGLSSSTIKIPKFVKVGSIMSSFVRGGTVLSGIEYKDIGTALTDSINQNEELSAAIEKGREQLRLGKFVTYEDVFGDK